MRKDIKGRWFIQKELVHLFLKLKIKFTQMERLLFLGNIGAPEIILIALLILLLFGGKKIPELMKGLGKGVKSFKEGLKEMDADDDKNPDEPKKDA